MVTRPLEVEAAWDCGPVGFDTGPTWRGQYPLHHRWNGWLMPRFDALTVVEILRWIEDADPATVTWHWREDGALVMQDDTYAEPETEVIEPDVDGLYTLGAAAWCWSREVL